MPRPVFKKQNNKDGKLYPWQIKGKDFAAYKSIFYYTNYVVSPAKIVGADEHKKVGELSGEMKFTIPDDHEFTNEEAAPVLGVNFYKGHAVISFGEEVFQPYVDYLTEDEYERGKEIYDEAKKIADEAADKLNKMYEGKTDVKSREYQRKANRYAEAIRLGGKALDPEAGNIIKAEIDNPALPILNNLWVDFPRFEEKGFEFCADTMEPIFDDYMTMVESGLNETLVQYHRQQMMQGEWTPECEQTYLNELRQAHQKTVEAYDRLWAVNDKGQHDAALGNSLDSMVGKGVNHRDMNNAVGMLRGEVRAIDMGYDSNHLYILGIIGQQEQVIKKMESELTLLQNTKEGEELEQAQNKMKALQEYKADFLRFKEGVWDKAVKSKEEMEEVGRQVDAFLESHQEKYADIQYFPMKEYKPRLDYAREEAAEAEVIRTPLLKNKDVETLMNVMGGTLELLGDETFPNMGMEILEMVSKGPSNTNTDGPYKFYLKDDYDKEVKDYASGIIRKMDDYIENRQKDEKYPRAENFKNLLAEYAKVEAEGLRDGIHIMSDPLTQNYGYKMVQSLMPQIAPGAAKPENADKIEAALKEFPLDEFIKIGIDLQRMQNEYTKRGAGMSDAEKDAFRLKLADKEQEMLDLSRDLKEKTKNPTETALNLFGKKEYLVADYQFAGKRGVGAVIENYEEKFAKCEIPDSQLDRLKAGLENFNAKAGLFGNKESGLHTEIREGFEKLQENLDKLKTGKVPGEAGKDRFMTSDEKLDLISETQELLNNLGAKTGEYAEGKAENKTRQDGAAVLRDVINDLQDTLMKEEQFEISRQTSKAAREFEKNNPDREAEQAANKAPENKVKSKDDFDVKPGRMKISLDDLEAEEMPDKAARKSTAGLTKKAEVNKEKKSAGLDI